MGSILYCMALGASIYSIGTHPVTITYYMNTIGAKPSALYILYEIYCSSDWSTFVLVGSCLATKVFIGNLPAMGRGWVIIK